MTPKIEVLANKAALTERALVLVKEKIQTTLQRQNTCTIALAGGGTPQPLYEALAQQSLPWDKLHIFWGDERYVSPDSSQSNQKMARQSWLEHVPLPPANIHPVPTDAADPAADAEKYEQELKDFFGVASEVPTFDLILLGIGDDAHTASLFPQTEALNVCDRLVTVGNKDGQPRITFTIPLLNKAGCVLFLVAGENKRPALKKVFASEADNFSYPARFVQPEGELWWLLDQAAGAELEQQS